MKKLVRKLALSVAALGVCAATLVSSTFAWYTSNTDVNASGMQAAAASTGDTSIFIAHVGSSNWGQDIEFTKVAENPTATEGEFIQNSAIIPVQAVVNAGAVVFENLNDVAQAGAWLEFSFQIKTSATTAEEAIPVYLKTLTIANTGTAGAYDNLLNGKDSTNSGVDVTKATYWVDITNALWMNIESTTYADIKTNIYDLGGIVSKVNSVNVEDEDADAEAYLEEVTGKTLTKGKTHPTDTTPAADKTLATEKVVSVDTNNTANALQVAALDQTGQVATTITIRVFLNGWDEFCFDACKGQEFTVDLTLTTDAKLALKAA